MYDVYNIHMSRGYKKSLEWDTFRRFRSNTGTYTFVNLGFRRCEIMQQFLLNIYYNL